MKMKKMLILGGVMIVLGATLVGCGTKENEVKSIEKEKGVANIEVEMNTKTQTQNNTNNGSNETKGKTVSKVDHIDLGDDGKHFIIIHGYDNLGNTVWEYKTNEYFEEAQFNMLEYITESYEARLILINEASTIRALDLDTGNTKWTYDNNAGVVYGSIDFRGNAYIYSLDGQDSSILKVIDNNGKVTKKYDLGKYANENELPIAMNALHSFEVIEYEEGTCVEIMFVSFEELDDGALLHKEDVYDVIRVNVNKDTVEFETLN